MTSPAVGLMPHRADVQRDNASTTTDWNTPVKPDWQTHLLNVKCFLWSRNKREAIDEEKIAVIEDLRCMMPLGTDVTEKDRIANVKDRQGVTIVSGSFDVQGLMRKHDHLELVLEKVAG